MSLPPASAYWVTDHGVKLRKPSKSVPYYRLDYRVGGRRVLSSVGKDETAAWAEAVRVDGLVAAAAGKAHDLPLSALAWAWHGKKAKVWAPGYAHDTRLLLERRVLPVIGGIPLGRLTEEDIAHIVTVQPSRSGRRHVYAAMSAMLTWGIGHKWLAVERADLIPAKDEVLEQSVGGTGEAQIDPAEIPDTSDVLALFREMQAPRSYASKHARKAFTPPPDRAYMVLLAAFCGLRQGEVFALRGRDLVGDLLLVDEQIQLVGGVLTEGLSPKGRKVRKVVVPETVGQIGNEDGSKSGVPLLAWLTARAKEAGPGGLLFTTTSGGPWRKSNYGRDVWGPARRSVWSEHPSWVFHSLRHHCATWLLNRGVPASVVASQLGHSSVRVTLDMYVGGMASSYDEVRAAHAR